jgi:hypothetical protein
MKISSKWRRCGSTISLVLACLATQVRAASVLLPEQTFPIKIGTTPTRVIAHPRYETTAENDLTRLKADVDFDLRDVQIALANALEGKWKTERCGDDLSTKNAIVVPKGNDLSIQAEAHYVKWACVFGGRTHIAEARGTVCLEIAMSAPHGLLRVDGRISCFDTKPILLGAFKREDLTDYLRAQAERELLQLVDKANGVLIPAQKLYSSGFLVDHPVFSDLGEGHLGAEIGGSALMTTAQFSEFQNAISSLMSDQRSDTPLRAK